MNIRILIVDDEKDIRNLLKEYFENKFDNLIVDTAENADIADQMIENSIYHFVFLDIVMPGMDPFELLQKIKELNKLVQVIIITANSTMDKVLNALEFGADDYLTKPFDFESLNEILESNIKKIIRWKNTFKNSL
ncbi:response regulator [Oceanotoga sp. DSM 15011]|jgi:DNA-binding response OmpR family regulator|uniref:Response regulator receiver domain-containing protein n=1 Tax=Oceanotoga teriensis TaxID=515440 RepID=A0AA45C686_9BACT|nr:MULTISPECIES: response regulator [Oceanotoga]MDN5343371.1 hypothetical protein [Oceanotoga sp.]MDO7975741.1 response regulator [Oceanotoga teriensis]PWJ91280.1 response regulator receiver domain-containing protein [Oceanotoga teriensis]UYO99755.1 response regulator [Oceanotoga sp. DSM 15011]